MSAMITTGFQATCLGQAVDEVNRMIKWRLSDEPIPADAEEEDRDPAYRASIRTRIFLGYTSNLVSAGVREHIRFLVQHKMVDAIVTTAGGVEEDIIKCLGHTYVGDFALKGRELRLQGQNRIGNMIIPNSNYAKFEEWMMPVLDLMLKEQKEKGTNWTPSKMIAKFGEVVNNPDSILYWAWKNDIPIFCPPLTDGSIGDMMYFHTYANPGLRCDIIEDIKKINDFAMRASPRKTGMILLG
jgi:deoxyhypusine synthase